MAASARISRDGLSVPSSRLVPSAPVRPPNDLRAKMEATVLMSTCSKAYNDEAAELLILTGQPVNRLTILFINFCQSKLAKFTNG